MSTRPIVVVGASLAGLRAAQAVRANGWGGPLLVIGDEPHLPYTRPPLSKELLRGEHDCAFPADLDVDWRLGTRATKLDVEARTVTAGEEIGYEKLIIATGMRARPCPGTLTLRSLDDAHALKLALGSAKTVAIIGAGFIGCEVASSARKLGLDVTLHDLAPQPMTALGPELGERCAQLHRDHGVTLKLGAAAEPRADVVVGAVGAIPNTEWLEGSGLTLERGVVCDANLQAAPHVFAAGDVVAWPHPLADGELIRIEHWTNAAEQGKAAGANALADTPKPYENVPYFWSDQHDVKIQSVGLAGRAERWEEIEPDVYAGSRDDRVVSVVTFNAPRRLAHFRRQLAMVAA